MHEDEVAVDEALVGRLVAAQFPRWAELPIEAVFPRGTDNALYRLGGELVVRLPRRPGAVAALEKERRYLPLVAPRVPVAVPEPVAEGRAAEGYPFAWSVYTWIDGRPAAGENVRDRIELARDLARFISSLRRLDPAPGPPPGRHNSSRGVPLERRDSMTRAGIAALAGRLDTELATAAWEIGRAHV